MNEVMITESISLREQLCTEKNTKILEQVGQLLTLPETGWATTEQVAIFYQVPENTIRYIVKRNQKELLSDGYKILSIKEFQKWHNATFQIPNRGLAIFPRRAVLRVGMLLRDSLVAKLVRSYLLNAEQQLGISYSNHAELQQMVQQLSQHSFQLIENAEELDKHANQLSSHAAELKKHATQLYSQTQMVKALVEEIYLNRRHVEQIELKTESNSEKIKALERLTNELLASEEGQYISEKQIEVLKKRVKAKGSPTKVWSQLKQQFEVTRYIFLPKSRFREVLDWLENYNE